MHSVKSGIKPDAIALMEPDWHGPKYDERGILNENHASRASNIKQLLSEQKVPRIVFSFFKDSQWYVDINRNEIENALLETGGKYFLIATPDDLEGHGGSWTSRFSNLYANCLSSFFLGEIDSESECDLPDINDSDYTNWATTKPIVDNNYRLLLGEETLNHVNKKALCRYYPAKDFTSKYNCLIWNEEGTEKSFVNEFGQLILTNSIIDFEPLGYCRHNGLYSPTYQCSQVYIIEDNLVAVSPNDTNGFSWYRLVDKVDVEKQFIQAKYYCRNTDKLEAVFCEAL